MPHVPTKKACPSLGDAHTSLRRRLQHLLLLAAHKACGRATALGKQEFTARVDGDDDGHGLRASDVPERVLLKEPQLCVKGRGVPVVLGFQ